MLCDVYEDEIKKLAEEFGSEEVAKNLASQDGKLISLYIPEDFRKNIRRITTDIGEKLTSNLRKIAKENLKLQGVIDIVDFNAHSGERIISDAHIHMQILSRYRLRRCRDIGDEYLKFAEGSGQSAGEYTRR